MSKLKVSIIQSDIIWDNKQANYCNLENIIADIDRDTDVIVMCEMFNTGFIMIQLIKQARNKTLLIGYTIK